MKINVSGLFAQLLQRGCCNIPICNVISFVMARSSRSSGEGSIHTLSSDRHLIYCTRTALSLKLCSFIQYRDYRFTDECLRTVYAFEYKQWNKNVLRQENKWKQHIYTHAFHCTFASAGVHLLTERQQTILHGLNIFIHVFFISIASIYILYIVLKPAKINYYQKSVYLPLKN